MCSCLQQPRGHPSGGRFPGSTTRFGGGGFDEPAPEVFTITAPAAAATANAIISVSREGRRRERGGASTSGLGSR
jgi:hypothetical protein